MNDFLSKGNMEENTAEVQEKWKSKSRGKFFQRLVKRRIPILEWLPKYDSEKFFNDAIAGVTVGLTVMPQGLAYATLAGLEPQVRKNGCHPLLFPVTPF